MIIRRPSPPQRPRDAQPKNFLAESEFGPCEAADCERHARGTCSNCSGDFCLKHSPHRAHAN